MIGRTVVASVCLLGAGAMPSAPAHAASAVQSSNCPNGLCAQFGPTDTIPVIRTYQFSMPRSGQATVTFNGSMFCAASGSPIQDRVIDLSSAITTTTTSAITATAPSYMRHAHVLKDHDDHVFDSSTSFNLASTRVLPYSSGGLKTVYFRIARARQDTNTTCYVYGGSFSVVITP